MSVPLGVTRHRRKFSANCRNRLGSISLNLAYHSATPDSFSSATRIGPYRKTASVRASDVDPVGWKKRQNAPCPRMDPKRSLRWSTVAQHAAEQTEEAMSGLGTIESVPWYRSLTRTHWQALIASNLGWAFDGFEVFSLILTVGVALRQLLDPSQYQFTPAYAGAILAITVFGWGIGGLVGGVLADYLGRKRSMALTIAAYSALTGLSALSWDWLSFAVFRFLVGLAIGSEWATGASITAELWPANARGKGGAFLHAGYSVGSILAAGVWLAIGTVGPNAWRYMYLIGVLPALIVFWIRRNIPESPRWEESNKRRRAAYDLRRRGGALKGEDAALVRFTLLDMFAEPAVRSRSLCRCP